ncbi:MAG: peptidoglycan DD-metalloendopeptidase family protein [Bacteroidia bacterium]
MEALVAFCFFLIEDTTKIAPKPYEGLKKWEEQGLQMAWNTQYVNAYRLPDIRKVIQPTRIVLEDSSKGWFFYPPVKGRVSSGFGFRRWQFHYGLDIPLGWRDSVYAAMTGKVRVAGYDPGGYGFFCVIAHPNGLETVYGHFSVLLVQSGQEVHAGELVGLAGSTGYSTGVHLHFEMRFLGEPLDCSSIVDFEEGRLLQKEIVVSQESFQHLEEIRKAVYHVIRRGQTLSHIAKAYGVTVTHLCRLNRISPRTILRPGRVLRVR